MHEIKTHKSVFIHVLNLFLVGVVGCLSGCVLEELPPRGQKCPPGEQVLEGDDAPYVEFDSIVCHHKYFVSRVYPVSLSTQLTDCCEQVDDVSWKCNLSKYDACKDKYSSDIKNNVTYCYYYQQTTIFSEDKRVNYSAICDHGEVCQENTEDSEICPQDFPDCELTDKSEENIFICNRSCSAPSIYCPDESTEDRKPVCINPLTDNLHCGATGSCTNEKEGDSKGVACENGKICIDGECNCPDGYDFCDGKCVYILKDHDNCGECGNKCAKGQACLNGSCQEDKCESEGITNACAQADCTNIPEKCGKNCIDCTSLPNTTSATCVAKYGVCEVSECDAGYHISQDKTSCEINNITSCGSSVSNEVIDCKNKIEFGIGWYCTNDGQCRARGCKKDEDKDENYSLDENGQCISACALCKDENNEICNEERTGCRCKENFAFCPEGDRGVCIDILTDHDHCGGCGEQFVCEPNQICKQAQCQANL